ncbi:siderophore ABC transporter substrate-binding protein [Sanguibacter antarcticus]|uniref:Iron complex transport system substrate-binding protein n=1 Tax=Sanguibacter antarcticus TaxID=372484 RepID=A0A2A9E981_9MICO|nr:ABC transporter substrate-binding protein [Sanguibacter antarcticus]PFG34865.1 iron complex transport system substrate-binding protein [Sanguibacter antarcticus]
MRLQSGRRTGALVALTATTLVLSACAGAADADTEEPAASTASTTVEIDDNHGTITVPVLPERVVALDNHVFETLSSWDVDLVAAPKVIMGDLWPVYTDDEAVLDVGSHFEPNLEAIIEAQPDLVIGGYRFAESYDDITAQNPDAAVIELSPREDQDISAELVRQIEILGQVFDREDDAAALVEALNDSVTAATEAYDTSETVVGLITSGGEIAYSAPVTGRSIGTVFPTLGLTPAIDLEADDVSHGDDISVEAIAAANPDWIIVLDRDGSGVGEGEYTSAAEIITGSEALSAVTAVAEDQVIYLDPSFYLSEDIQAYTALYEQIAQAFSQSA